MVLVVPPDPVEAPVPGFPVPLGLFEAVEEELVLDEPDPQAHKVSNSTEIANASIHLFIITSATLVRKSRSKIER